ncbi:hypothetical protein ASPBRDRAFT_25701 [Aspergillus brasiliensis CBS 101740]|uniref:Uncharacterized protein n=1 Tax=Aspergillus brasiliensis (strain CBS 101740 / IMI 381727 / IBT 21946) TaxID=767769 RepID=A0A1L9V2C2_ASPBC|nr:hypothetical protein ASPBRDRAFT_25701 [Aspergillus brasiliensis CBS 101740]
MSKEIVHEKCEQLMIARQSRSPHQMFRTLSNLLEWSWKVVACLILNTLDFTQTPTDEKWPHIRWILTGALSQMPIHAAGYQFKGTSDTVLDRVISSYDTSIKELIYARRRGKKSSGDLVSKHALLVSMPHTPCQGSLAYADKEVQVLRDICSEMQLIPVEPAKRTEIIS